MVIVSRSVSTENVYRIKVHILICIDSFMMALLYILCTDYSTWCVPLCFELLSCESVDYVALSEELEINLGGGSGPIEIPTREFGGRTKESYEILQCK
jgi:hypothetical protein